MKIPSNQQPWARVCGNPGRGGFTLVELLVVVGIMTILVSLTVAAFVSVGDSSSFATEVTNLQQAMDDARAYAMGNNTYVFMGLEEVDGTQSTSAVPQTAGVGRVAMVVVASKDGTNNGYNVVSSGSWYGSLPPPSLTTSNLVPINKLTLFPNLHLRSLIYGDSLSITASSPLYHAASGTGSVSSSNDLVTEAYDLGYASTHSAFGYQGANFYWPLSATSTTTAQYTFNVVIQFNPDGTITTMCKSQVTTESTPQWMELDLQQTHANILPVKPTTATLLTAAAGHQLAIIQIDGVTGQTRLYQQ